MVKYPVHDLVISCYSAQLGVGVVKCPLIIDVINLYLDTSQYLEEFNCFKWHLFSVYVIEINMCFTL